MCFRVAPFLWIIFRQFFLIIFCENLLDEQDRNSAAEASLLKCIICSLEGAASRCRWVMRCIEAPPNELFRDWCIKFATTSSAFFSRSARHTEIRLTFLESWGFQLSNEGRNIFVPCLLSEIIAKKYNMWFWFFSK